MMDNRFKLLIIVSVAYFLYKYFTQKKTTETRSANLPTGTTTTTNGETEETEETTGGGGSGSSGGGGGGVVTQPTQPATVNVFSASFTSSGSEIYGGQWID
jgi:uncharacterized membrane protein YgcG